MGYTARWQHQFNWTLQGHLGSMDITRTGPIGRSYHELPQGVTSRESPSGGFHRKGLRAPEVPQWHRGRPRAQPQ